MRKVFLFLVPLLLLFSSSSRIFAACTFQNFCAGAFQACRNPDTTIYACCDTPGDVCPANPNPPPPTPPPGSFPVTSGSILCSDNVSINTALGCINIQGSGAFGPILNWATGIAGTFVFIMIIISAFMITTAQGDPKRVKAGQELLTSAIAGFVLIALAVVILNFIGVKVLGLDLFGFQG